MLMRTNKPVNIVGRRWAERNQSKRGEKREKERMIEVEANWIFLLTKERRKRTSRIWWSCRWCFVMFRSEVRWIKLVDRVVTENIQNFLDDETNSRIFILLAVHLSTTYHKTVRTNCPPWSIQIFRCFVHWSAKHTRWSVVTSFEIRLKKTRRIRENQNFTVNYYFSNVAFTITARNRRRRYSKVDRLLVHNRTFSSSFV